MSFLFSAMAVTAVTSMITTGVGSPTSGAFWALIHQYQLLLCLPILGVYIPEEILYYISEFDFVSLDMSWLPFPQFWFLKKIDLP